MPVLPRLIAASCCAAAAPAMDEFLAAFDPRPTPEAVSWRASAEVRADAAAGRRDGAGSLAIDREAVGLSWLALRGEADEVWLRGRVERVGIAGDARLADGADPAGDYWSSSAAGTWKHRLGGGDLVGAMATVTRAGQAPLSRGMEWGANATAFARLGLGEEGRDGLLLALNYDADRVFFGDFPVLPLVAWQAVRGPWILLVGAPFTAVTYRAEDWRASAVIGPLPAVSAELRLHGPLHAFGELRWSTLQLRRAQREEHDARLTLSQWETAAGLRLEAGPGLACELALGIATARRLGEDEDDGDARRTGIALEAAPFAALRGRIVF